MYVDRESFNVLFNFLNNLGLMLFTFLCMKKLLGGVRFSFDILINILDILKFHE